MVEEDGGSEGLTGTSQKELLRKVTYIGMSLFFMSYAFFIWNYYGYIDFTAMVVNWIFLAESAIAIILAASRPFREPFNSIIPVFMIVTAIVLFFVSVYPSFPSYGTDEIAIDTYAGYLFVHGLDPYNPANMASVFSFYGVEPYFVTPLLTGGVVSFLVYPGFSVLVFSLPVLFHFPSNTILLASTVGVFLVLFLYYRKSNLAHLFPTVGLLILINVNYLYYSVGGVTDIVWVLLVMISYILRKKPLIAGLIFGLAISFKQTPVLILPFLLYFIYMETRRSNRAPVLFLSGAAGSFVVTNIPFIIMSPGMWFSGVMSIWTQQTVGIGDGLGALSFLGYININQQVFNVLFLAVAVFCFILYVLYFSRLKFAFFAFPVLIFIFHFRLLSNYMMYWPILIMLVFPDFLHDFYSSDARQKVHVERHTKSPMPKSMISRRAFLAITVSILLLSTGFMVYRESSDPPSTPFVINSVSSFGNPYQIPDSVTAMTVNLTYNPGNGMPANMPIFFRIIPSSSIVTANGLLWKSSAATLAPGNNTLILHPENIADLLPYNTSFRVIAYYSSYQSVFSHSGISSGNMVLLGNPGMIYPINGTSSTVYPSWNYQSVNGSTTDHYSFYPGGIILDINSSGKNSSWSASELVNSYVHFRSLEEGNYSLNISVKALSGGAIRSSVDPSGKFGTFTGVEISFLGGLEQIWIGFNSSLKTPEFLLPNSNTIYEITPYFNINFSQIESFASNLNWQTNNTVLALVVGSSQMQGTYGCIFSNLELVKN